MPRDTSKSKRSFAVCCSIVFVVVAITAMRSFLQPDMDNVVPIATARKAAQNEVSATELLEEWHGAVVSSEEPIIFFDLNQHASAYVFKVMKGGQYAGYMTVSASFDFYPIREYSTAPFPTEDIEKCRQKAASLIGTLSQTYELIYLGGTIYLVRFTSLSRNDVVVSLSPSGLVIAQESLERAQLSLEEKANEIQQEARLAWGKM